MASNYYLVRQYNNLLFRIYNVLQWIKYFISARNYSETLNKHNLLIDSRKNKRCFIVLGGESATNFDFHRIIGEDIFVVNHFYHTQLHSMLKPRYYVATDSKFFEGFPELFESLKDSSEDYCSFIFPLRHLSQDIASDPQVYPFWDGVRALDSRMPLNPSGMFPKFGTVALSSIGLAIAYGYSEVFMIGYDLPPGYLPHFYKENSEQVDSMKRERVKVGEYEYCELFWQYTNCQHENYCVADLARRRDIKIYNLSNKSYVKSFLELSEIDL